VGKETMRTYQGQAMSGIAIYEEDQMMRALLQEWLCGAGYQVQVAASCAIEPAGKADLAIVSIFSPKVARAQVLQEIQTAHPGKPVIALSGQFRGGLSTAGAAAQSLGVTQVIAKPLTRDALLVAVHAMIGPPT
jgi:DNA-binding NtrC family response regulator